MMASRTCSFFRHARASHLLIWVTLLLLAEKPTQILAAATVTQGSGRDEFHPEDQQHRKTAAAQYGRLSLTQIYNEMDALASSYPDFVTVTSSQDEFNLPPSCRSFETQHVGCTNRYLVIEDPVVFSHESADTALKQRPDVFLSGALHGDERVGPVAMIEMAKLLALAVSCEAEKANAIECNSFYEKYTASQAAWLARLVSTRRIVIVPAANAKGFHTNSRWESYLSNSGYTYNLDPNRDFSFDNQASQCMQTIAARTINELFLEYLFQMSMTYHGGIENITFEWGATSIPRNRVSPDDRAQRIMAEKMSLYAGELNPSFSSNQFYETGDMNTVLYGVYGGFEDWVYAGSWKRDMTVRCDPELNGGYDGAKTTYDDATLSTFNILVEVSNAKNPRSNKFGTETSLLNAPFRYDSNVNNGYATKHIRTTLMAIDAVEPYVEIRQCKETRFIQEIKPLTALTPRWSRGEKHICANFREEDPKVWWTVGGSFSVDETFLLYGKWSDLPSQFNAINQPDHQDLMEIMNSSKFYKTDIQSGDALWSDPTSGSIPDFNARVELSHFSGRDNRIAVFAVAKVDQNWLEQPSNIWPNVGVQSHMVKIRTDPDYLKSKEGREVKGHLYWISVPLTINNRKTAEW